MKPAPFRYHAPTSLREALDVLAEVGADGKVLAGGQSLVPILSMRLAQPAHLIDINRLSGELGGVTTDTSGVRVGALARHYQVEADAAAGARLPLLAQALRLVAHPVIRNRGTSVGSIAHADPAAELPAVLALVEGTVQVGSVEGTRTVAAADFFTGPLETSLQPGELVLSVHFPALAAGTGTAFVEVSRRHGDYAVCGVAAAVMVDAGGCISSARTAYVSMADTPVVLDLTAQLHGRRGDDALADAGQHAAGQLEPDGDIHATADYRRHLAGVLTGRALRMALAAAAAAAAVAPVASACGEPMDSPQADATKGGDR